jgi:hypothetical protein
VPQPVAVTPPAPVRPVAEPVRPVVVAGSVARQLAPATAPEPAPEPATEVEQVRPVSAPAGDGESGMSRVFAHLSANVWAGETKTPEELNALAAQTGVVQPSASRYARMWRKKVEAGEIVLRRKPLSVAPRIIDEAGTDQ